MTKVTTALAATGEGDATGVAAALVDGLIWAVSAGGAEDVVSPQATHPNTIRAMKKVFTGV